MPTKTDTDGVTYLEAIGQAMMSEMEADPDVYLIGEDDGQIGGAIKVTKGFLEKYGPRRVIDTPIAETGYTPNLAARQLVTTRSDTVGMIIAEDQRRVFGEPFFGALMHGVVEAMAATRFHVVVVVAARATTGCGSSTTSPVGISTA